MSKKLVSILLVLVLAVGMLPVSAMAAGIQEDTPTFAVNDTDTVIHFAGREWYVIGDNASGVVAPSGLTLLAKRDFGACAFRVADNSQANKPGWKYSYSAWFQGSFYVPGDYNDSTLMRALTSASSALPANEAAHITTRNFGANADGISGAAVNDQKLWPLSWSEAVNDVSLSQGTFSRWFWLRTERSGNAAGVSNGSGGYNSSIANNTHDIRPALYLNLSSVLFTSNASTTGKPSAVGGGLVSAQALSGELKFTFSDGSAAPAVTLAGTTNGTNTLRFGYSGAATGTNQYLSCVLVNSGGAVAYYGKLADCASNASGMFSISTGGLVADTYTLKVFSEQANGNDNSDFASSTADFSLTVSGDNGTVSGGTIDNTAPTVSTVAPSGATGFTSGNIVITFSEDMSQAAGIGAVKLDSGAALTGGAWTDSKTYTVPYSGLTAGATYTVGISGFQDAAGNIMAADNTHQFTAKAGNAPNPAPAPTIDRVTGTQTSDDDDNDNTPNTTLKTGITLSGGGTWTGGDLTFIAEADGLTPEQLLRVLVDLDALGQKDYTVRQGSVIVTLKESYLKTLAPGEYVLGLEFVNHSGSIIFTVDKQLPPLPITNATPDGTGIGGDNYNPNTGR